MNKELKLEIALDKTKKVDSDVATLMDLVIGDYLECVMKSQPKQVKQAIIRGIRKVCMAFNLKPEILDVDGYFKEESLNKFYKISPRELRKVQEKLNAK